VSTAADYLRFGQLLLNGGELDGARILSPATVRRMTTNSLPPDIQFAGGDMGPRGSATFGLGFGIRSDAASSWVPDRSAATPGTVSGEPISGSIRRSS